MGAVMPPETEGTAALQAPNGHHSPKVGANFALSPTNGKIHEKEITGKLNGILDLDDQPPEADPEEEAATCVGEESSTNGDEDDEVIQESKEHLEIESAPSEIEVEDGELSGEIASGPPDSSNGDTSSKGPDAGLDSSSQWTAAGANSGWEIAEDQGLLGPGPAAEEKPAEYKPTPALQHTFYMIRIPRPIDSKGKTEIRMADLRLKEKAEKRDSINVACQMKRASRNEALDKLKAARERVRACGEAARNKQREVEPLQSALRKLKDTGRMARDKSRDLPSSEQELDERIAYFEYRIQHESIPLREEKQLLRDIKNLKACREEVCANEALHAEFSESLGEREDIQERLKPLISELESLRADWTLASEKVKSREEEFERMDEALNQVQAQFVAASRARQDAYEERAVLMRQENARNDEFYQNRREVQHVRQLAYKKEKKVVEELCNAQVERVMGLWNNNDAFRAAYLKSNERSTLKRLQTFDGRALGPDEEPPLISGDGEDAVFDNRIDAGPSVTPANLQREEQQSKLKSPEPTNVPAHSTPDTQRNELERGTGSVPEPNGRLSASKAVSGLNSLSQSSGQEEQVQANLVAAAELKEKRRQQEMAKAREAEERKRRSAERLQSKALARAQKEAERREKEKEKKARKKAASLLSSSNEGISLPAEISRGDRDLQGVEPGSEVRMPEVRPESKPAATKQKRRPISQKLKAVSTPPGNSKKDGIHTQTWFWIVAGLVILLGILAILAMRVL